MREAAISGALTGWTPVQRHVVIASYLGWTLDAFDFFLFVFVIKDVAQQFTTSITSVNLALVLTLAMRPVGAFIFGRLADRYGRQPILMADVALYSLFGFATAFSPNLIAFLVIRALFGVAMGGEWGVGASLTMEHVKPEARGLVSGILQSGYPSGYLLASVAFGLLYPHIGWRGMFMVSVVPALLILYIRSKVPESPTFQRKRAVHVTAVGVLITHWKLALYAIVLMTAFNFFSHGTQDLYPTFLQIQRHFDHDTVSLIAVIYNIGAVVGGLTFGIFSQAFGRKRTIIAAAHSGNPSHLAMGLFDDGLSIGVRRFHRAVLRARSLGRDTRASQRIVATRSARHISGHGLSARQFYRVVKCGAAGQVRRDTWQQLCTRASVRGFCGGARDHGVGLFWSRGEGRQHGDRHSVDEWALANP